MCRYLDEVAAQLVRPRVLDLERGLIYAGEDSPSDCNVHVVGVPCWVLDHGDALLRQVDHCALDRLLVADPAGRYLHIGAVERVLELLRRGVGGRPCEILERAEGLFQPRIEELL